MSAMWSFIAKFIETIAGFGAGAASRTARRAAEVSSERKRPARFLSWLAFFFIRSFDVRTNAAWYPSALFLRRSAPKFNIA